MTCVCALCAPLTAGADSEAQTLLAPSLLEAAQAQPDAAFDVIVQSSESTGSAADAVRTAASVESTTAVADRFVTVQGVAATVTGSQLMALAQSSAPLVITRDDPMTIADEPTDPEPPSQQVVELPVSVPANTEQPAVLGDAEPRRTLTATPGAWSGGALTYAYAWERCSVEPRAHGSNCEEIHGAAEAAYTPTVDDLGLRLRVSVTAINDLGSSTAASQPTEPVTVRPPVQASEIGILGTAEEDQKLSAAHGSWDGTPPFDFDYQWQRCDAGGESCTDIDRANKPTYTLDREDVKTTVRLLLTVRNDAGEASASSEPTSPVLAMPARHPRFKQHWPYVAGVDSLLAATEATTAQPATIAIVDSGIDADRVDFGGRVIEQVTLTEREPNSPGDGNGHGTAVASVAAGEAEGYTGAAPDANLVSIDVLDDHGVGSTSDVIAAADWIYEHRERLNIRVANFSLHGTSLASLVSDPLDKAVERLWLSGIVVVAAAGNYATDGAESAVPFAPGNDPFVLTVGATDTGGSFTKRDDVAAPWSAWGYTRDGFAKPELVAPGRYIAAAVSSTAKLTRDRPDRVVEPGYMQLSGTSLAAPVVAGSAATILGVHPDWSPDQVKGALMLTTEPLPRATPRSVGVGSLNAHEAAAVVEPPNPNLALNQFLVPDPSGSATPVFDASAWTQVVASDPAWSSVAWGSVAWGSAAWSSVAWGSVAWGSVAWGSVAWGSVAWGSVAWGSVAWGSHHRNDFHPGGGYWVRN
ncbi:MAG TPA: S8 family serine peptidase [Gaiellaceae bacterium]|nr:S8 family serine peptidase [Gaiellaceae bacterium]